jgi:acyl carrier protein
MKKTFKGGINMDYQTIRKNIMDIIADIAIDEDLSNIDDNIRLREQLDLDSMDFLDIVMELKKRHKIEVPTEDYMNLATMKSCIEYLGPKFSFSS